MGEVISRARSHAFATEGRRGLGEGIPWAVIDTAALARAYEADQSKSTSMLFPGQKR
jgi:hypothetical protein